MLAGPEVAAPTCFYVILLFHQMRISPPASIWSSSPPGWRRPPPGSRAEDCAPDSKSRRRDLRTEMLSFKNRRLLVTSGRENVPSRAATLEVLRQSRAAHTKMEKQPLGWS